MGKCPARPRGTGAEIRLLHGAEAEAMLIVVTRRAQTTAELA
jgi:hypothetical protein